VAGCVVVHTMAKMNNSDLIVEDFARDIEIYVTPMDIIHLLSCGCTVVVCFFYPSPWFVTLVPQIILLVTLITMATN